ncbi:hypothetical protein GCM10027090_22530 [Sinomonas soli]
MRKWAAAAATGGALLLTACGGGSQASGSTPSPTPTPKPTTYAGETASAIAAAVPSCTQVTQGDIGAGGPDLTSTATCVIGGRTVRFNSWNLEDSAFKLEPVLKADKVELYYASGTGWTANVEDGPTLQWQLTNNASALLQASFAQKTDPPRDLPGEKETLQKVADAFAGSTLNHYTP